MKSHDLVAWRQHHNYTPEQLAEIAGIGPRQYRRMEEGKSPVRPYLVTIIHLMGMLESQKIVIDQLKGAAHAGKN